MGNLGPKSNTGPRKPGSTVVRTERKRCRIFMWSVVVLNSSGEGCGLFKLQVSLAKSIHASLAAIVNGKADTASF